MRVINNYRIILLFLIIKDKFRQNFCKTYNMIKIKGVIMGSSTRNSYKRSDKIIKQGIEKGNCLPSFPWRTKRAGDRGGSGRSAAGGSSWLRRWRGGGT